ncbi:acyl-homoserine-lactone synthase [Aestuariivita boseongensis]|uniref:acyl-homoserine-lactone synthase n=1 Tax=Aestuariivita boseongensis TaxID=1470562 RepID=UPI0006808473|nr:acyl-homoserine-lactone synthase [Aestuariivita boseongensis]
MLRYLYGHDLHLHPKLSTSMFRDRADQFSARLGWDVHVNANGEERDDYDALDPLYVIWQRPDGAHGGSMRFLPTTGPVMVNEVFGHLTGGAPIQSPLIWECTRFCLSRDAGPRVAAALMLGGGEIMRGFGIRHFAGVFDRRMERIYRAIGSWPEILGSEGEGRDRISVGLWSFDADAQSRVATRAGISPDLSRLWFRRAFGDSPAVLHARSA